MPLYQPDRDTLVLIDRPLAHWFLAALTGWFMAVFLGVTWHMWPRMTGNFLLPAIMTLGGMLSIPVLLAILPAVVVLTLDRKRRLAVLEVKRLWGTRREEAHFNGSDAVQPEKYQTRYGYAERAAIQVDSGAVWTLPHQSLMLANSPEALMDLVRGFLDPARASGETPDLPTRSDARWYLGAGLVVVLITIASVVHFRSLM